MVALGGLGGRSLRDGKRSESTVSKAYRAYSALPTGAGCLGLKGEGLMEDRRRCRFMDRRVAPRCSLVLPAVHSKQP